MLSGYRAPCTVILEVAFSISCMSSDVSSMEVAPMFWLGRPGHWRENAHSRVALLKQGTWPVVPEATQCNHGEHVAALSQRVGLFGHPSRLEFAHRVLGFDLPCDEAQRSQGTGRILHTISNRKDARTYIELCRSAKPFTLCSETASRAGPSRAHRPDEVLEVQSADALLTTVTKPLLA